MTDWHKHNGNGIPVPPKAVMNVRFRDNTAATRKAKDFDWLHENDEGDIVAYQFANDMSENEARMLARIWTEKHGKEFQGCYNIIDGKKIWKVVEVGLKEYARAQFSAPCFKCGAARDCEHREG